MERKNESSFVLIKHNNSFKFCLLLRTKIRSGFANKQNHLHIPCLKFGVEDALLNFLGKQNLSENDLHSK